MNNNYGWRGPKDNAVSNMLALHTTDLSLIPGFPFGPKVRRE